MTGANILEKNMSTGLPRSVLEKVLHGTFAVLFFLLPLQTRWILREAPLYEWGTISIYVVEVLGWVVIAFELVRTRRLRIKDLRFKWWVVGLVALAFFSIFWAPDKAVALQAAVRLFEGVLLFFVVRSMPHTTRYKMLWAFLTGAVLQAGLGIYQFLSQSTFASTLLGMALHDPQALGTSVVEFGDERWLRAYGGLPHPNVLGGYLVVAFVVLLLIWRGRVSGNPEARLPYIIFAIAPILLTGIFFSFSRTAWVAALIVMVYWACDARIYSRQSDLKRSHYIALGMMMLYMVFLVALYRPLVMVRLASGSSDRLEIRSRVERVEGVREAWQMVRRHPVWGVGIGNYTQAVARELRPGQSLYFYQPVHNVFLLALTELGIVGLALWAVILYFIVSRSKHAVLLFCSFAVLLLADHYLWTLPFGILLFWGILGLFRTIHSPPLDKKTAL